MVPNVVEAYDIQDFSEFQRGVRWNYMAQHGLAHDRFEEIAAADPSLLERTRATYEAALCLLHIAPEHAKRTLQHIAAKAPDTQSASFALYHLGNAAFIAEEFSESLTYYVAVQDQHLSASDAEQLHYRAAYAHFSQQHWEEAIKHFDTARTYEGPYAHAACYYTGYARLRTARYPEALENLEEAAQHAAYQAAVPVLIAQVYYEQRKFQDLLTYINQVRCLSGKPKDEQGLFLLAAEAHYCLEQYRHASQCYERYLAHPTRGTPAELLYRAAYAHLQTGSDEKALRYFERVSLESGTVAGNACCYSALLYLRQKRPEDARALLGKHMQQQGTAASDQDVLFLYAHISYQLGYISDAIRTLEQFTKVYPDHSRLSDVHTLLSKCYLSARRYEHVMAQLDGQATPKSENRRLYQQAAFYRGGECFNQKEYEQSVRWLRKSLQHPIDPALVEDALAWLGESHAAGGNYTQAQQAYHQLLNLPSFSKRTDLLQRVYYGLGYACFNTADYAQAAQNFQLYREAAASGDISTHLNDAALRWADCQYGLKDYPRALQAYQRLHPHFPAYTHYQCARIYRSLQDYDRSRTAYRNALTEQAEPLLRENALFEAARLELEQSCYTEAIKYFTQLIDENGQGKHVPAALLGRALAYTNTERHQDAIEDCVQILKNPATSRLTAHNALLELSKLLAITKRSKELPDYIFMYRQHCGQDNATAEIESALFDLAKNTFYAENYTLATVQLDDFQKSYPDSVYLAEALFMSAEACCFLGKTDEALQRYAKLIDTDQTPALRLKALRRLASLSHDRDDLTQACHYYELLCQAAPTPKDSSRALVGLTNTRYALKRYDAARASAEVLLKMSGVAARESNQAHLVLGKIAAHQRRHTDALKHLNSASKSLDPMQAVEALYTLADLHYHRAHYQRSLATLFQLNERFPKQTAWTYKAFLLIAENYISLKDHTHARATLKSLVDHALDKATQFAAKKRLSELNEEAQASGAPPKSKVAMQTPVSTPS